MENSALQSNSGFSAYLLPCLLGAFLFCIDVNLRTPTFYKITLAQEVIRYIYFFGLYAVVFWPVLVVTVALLQKLSSWFMDAQIKLKTLLRISTRATFYNVILLLVSFPLILFESVHPLIFQELLFLCFLGCAGLWIHLFKNAYQVLAGFSNGRALYTALLPILLVIIVFAATWALSLFAAFHYA